MCAEYSVSVYSTDLDLFTADESRGEDLTECESLHFSIEELNTATMNFPSNNKLGQRGFGIVYKVKHEKIYYFYSLKILNIIFIYSG